MNLLREIVTSNRFKIFAIIWTLLVLLCYFLIPSYPEYRIPNEIGITAWSPDGRWFAGVHSKQENALLQGREGGTFRVHDAKTGEPVQTIIEKADNLNVGYAQFTADGLYFLTSVDNTLQVWNTDSWKKTTWDFEGILQSIVKVPNAGDLAMALSPRTKPRAERFVSFLDIPSGEEKFRIGPVTPRFHRPRQEEAAIEVSADGTTAVTVHQPKGGKAKYTVWNLESREPGSTIIESENWHAMGISTDGKTMCLLVRKRPLTMPDNREELLWEFQYWNLEDGLLDNRFEVPPKSGLEDVLSSTLSIRFVPDTELLELNTSILTVFVNPTKKIVKLESAEGLGFVTSPDGKISAQEVGETGKNRRLSVRRTSDQVEVFGIDSLNAQADIASSYRPLGFSPDSQSLLFIDYTETSVWASVQAVLNDALRGQFGKPKRVAQVKVVIPGSGESQLVMATCDSVFFGSFRPDAAHVLIDRNVISWTAPV